MKPGDIIKFNSGYIEEMDGRFAGRANHVAIQEWFRRIHKIKKIKGSRSQFAVVHCPLGIGMVRGEWSAAEYKFTILEEKQGPCQCSWTHCRKRETVS